MISIPVWEATDFFRPADFIYPFGTHVAVVEVERDTGVISLREYYSVDDCGPRISPLLVEGQIHGGLAPRHRAGTVGRGDLR